jgi:hypothetical protein
VQGHTARFTVVAGPIHAALPLSYRWLTNGVLYQSNLSATLVMTNCQANRAVRCQLFNIAGSANSTNAALTVLADLDGDGMPDAFELSFFGSTTNASASVDTDGDGMSNLQEFLAGTDPTNALSYLKLEPLAWAGASNVLLQFGAVSNRNYTIEFRDSLETGGWSNLFTIPAVNSNRVMALTNAVATPMRVYRIAIPSSE